MNRLLISKILLLITFIAIRVPAFSAVPLVLEPDAQEYEITGKYLDILEDPKGTLRIEDIRSPEYQDLFRTYPANYHSKNTRAVYWLRFTLDQPFDHEFSPVLEFYDVKTNLIQLYIPDGKGAYKVKEAGDTRSFREKEYQHLNFVFDLQKIQEGRSTYYVRMHSSQELYLHAMLRTHQRLVDYTTQEYFYLALFYGVIIAMMVYYLFMFLSLREAEYFFHLLYAMSIGFYTLSKDGLGYQFLWPSLPALNAYIESIALTSMVVAALVYAKTFLNTRVLHPWLDKLINTTIVVRILYLIISILLQSPFIHKIYIDILTLFIPFLSGIISFRKGFVPARYYLLGYTMLFIGLVVTCLQYINILPGTIVTFYAFHIGVMLQMMILTFALTDKVRLLMRENDRVQKIMIRELKEKEQLKDQINKELEYKVQERTRELQYRIEQLDTFVYRASHDIKGPIRSLIGLGKLGMCEAKDEETKEYFEHTLKTSSRLDKILETLLNTTRKRQAALTVSPVNFEEIIANITSVFQSLNELNNFSISTNIAQQEPFYSDQYLLYSIIQNIVENAIRYKSEAHSDPRLSIFIQTLPHGAELLFQDNGKGIQKEYTDKVFDMFIRLDEGSNGSGLGLYIVKQYIEKLQGTIELDSQLGLGTTIRIYLPNFNSKDYARE
jgi:signal transduction histidine kinase